MSRVKRGVTVRRRHKKMLALAKGYRGGRSKVFTLAKNAVMKAGTNAYRDRRRKKREFRRLWIVRLNAAVKLEGLNYSRFIYGLSKADVQIDRKVLADLAVNNEKEFKQIVELAKKAL
ncbi:50S ribosomal protein L20 [Candidatus Peregrinibacteria bacterium]|nr:50S ribosomal protein L20 [Candidatus Peregrinibacteria bacterium]